ncbi:MAG: 4-alpha-glucanotransferase [Prevotella sp.]|nr:4-alpha-glucanotransferase [Prevotella sp.]
MNILLNIAYVTNFGEELILNLISEKVNGESVTIPYRMTTVDGKVWTCNLKLDFKVNKYIDYYYSVLRGENNIIREEWKTEAHRLELHRGKVKNFIVFDRWIDIPEDSYLYSSAFTDCIYQRKIKPTPLNEHPITVRIKVRAPQLRGNERLMLVGNEKILGSWKVKTGVIMHEHNYNEWVADIDVKKLSNKTFEYKFVAVDIKDNENIIWEDRNNRNMYIPDMEDGSIAVYEVEGALFPIYNTKCAGTLVPVFSLRSKDSFGVGDFGDLKKMIDWVSLTKQRVLQILPINDTTTTHTWTDSYPYSCISIFALHPQYVDLNALPQIADETRRKEFEVLREELNALKQIDYERVNNAKNEYLSIIYTQEGKNILASTKFKTFFKENESWLVPYAQYCFLREKNGTADFSKWLDHNSFDENERRMLSNPRNAAYKQVAFYYFVQFILNSQMASVHDYARSKGVILKGDIPIGVNRYGCDVWQEPRYFNLNGQAGAPPDDFSVNGQNWGFPTYNWDEMLKDDCKWWVHRFSNMAKFFDAYRIDHVLGFFRIWEIPVNAVHGLLGQFAPALGMTREEIETYGLHFQEELFTEPFITDWVLDRMFGEKADMVRKKYLKPTHDGRYKMKSGYDTQRKVEAAFIGKTDQEDINLRDGLYALISDVLFVRDHKDVNKFHPRISVQFDFIYESLYDSDKALFNNIYNDYFYHRNNNFWYREAMNKLPKLINATRMLVCAEDLGMVPACVSWVMNELKILSLELQSMPKDSHIRFGILANNPYRSVCTISSHDTPTLRQWWDENYERTQDYYNSSLHKYGMTEHPLPGWLAKEIIAKHLACPSMLCILSIQDWLSIDENLRLADANAERINIPANPHHYWRYRMHLNIEDLINNKGYIKNVSNLISENGRQ